MAYAIHLVWEWEGTRSKKQQSCSCSPHIDSTINAKDTNVESIKIEGDKLNDSKKAITDFYNDAEKTLNREQYYECEQ